VIDFLPPKKLHPTVASDSVGSPCALGSVDNKTRTQNIKRVTCALLERGQHTQLSRTALLRLKQWNNDVVNNRSMDIDPKAQIVVVAQITVAHRDIPAVRHRLSEGRFMRRPQCKTKSPQALAIELSGKRCVRRNLRLTERPPIQGCVSVPFSAPT
jgi:hypothetical protein